MPTALRAKVDGVAERDCRGDDGVTRQERGHCWCRRRLGGGEIGRWGKGVTASAIFFLPVIWMKRRESYLAISRACPPRTTGHISRREEGGASFLFIFLFFFPFFRLCLVDFFFFLSVLFVSVRFGFFFQVLFRYVLFPVVIKMYEYKVCTHM